MPSGVPVLYIQDIVTLHLTMFQDPYTYRHPASKHLPCPIPPPPSASSSSHSHNLETGPAYDTSTAMCNVTKNYYIYEQCNDPGLHFVRTSMDGNTLQKCPQGPHERYIVQPGRCPLCHP